jgi:hypothetical protein
MSFFAPTGHWQSLGILQSVNLHLEALNDPEGSLGHVGVARVHRNRLLVGAALGGRAARTCSRALYLRGGCSDHGGLRQ